MDSCDCYAVYAENQLLDVVQCEACEAGLTPAQNGVLSVIDSAWDGVCVYDTDNNGLVLMVGHKGSEYHFSLVATNGERQRISDPLNQSHWLEGITSGDYSLLWSEAR